MWLWAGAAEGAHNSVHIMLMGKTQNRFVQSIFVIAVTMTTNKAQTHMANVRSVRSEGGKSDGVTER